MAIEPKEYEAPLIKNIQWGKVIVKGPNGEIKEYKDCKIWPDGSREWNWIETGTEHEPGVQISDLQDIIDRADVFVISTGQNGLLKVKDEAKEHLKKNNKEFFIEKTEDAVTKYNQLVATGKRVAALIHSTC